MQKKGKILISTLFQTFFMPKPEMNKDKKYIWKDFIEPSYFQRPATLTKLNKLKQQKI